MTIRSISNTFNRGELDPSLLARDDLDLYAKGARKMRNMVALWTGAATIAPGSIYIDTIIDREDSNAVITDASYVKGFDFTYDADNEVTYTIILRKSQTKIALDIYYNDTLQATLNPASDAALGNYLATQIQDIHFAFAHDRVLILHESIQITQLKRGASHSSWTATTLTPTIYPTFDFSRIDGTSYSSYTFTLGAAFGTIGSSITFTSSSAVFTANHVGGLFRGNRGGIGRITAVADSTNATLTVLEAFSRASHAGDVSILYEKMWNSDTTTTPVSKDRGWPSRGNFYLNRAILGRTSALKNVLCISTAGIFDDFDDSDLDGLVAFSVTLNGQGEQSIQSIVADDSLLFTTTNKLFAQSPLVESPLTINNVYFAPQNQAPASEIETVSIDNQTLFVSNNKTKVMQAIYETERARYTTLPATILSNNIIDVINSNAPWDPPGIASRLYLATQENGTMLMLSTLQSQQVAAWSLRNTIGNFKQVIGNGRLSHVVVEREILLDLVSFSSTIDKVYLSDPTFKARYDVTTNFSTATGVSDITVFEDQSDYILIGNQAPFTAIDFDLATGASADCNLLFEYLDGNGDWDTFSPTDNTSGFTVDGSITWAFTDVPNWKPYDLGEDENLFWLRIRRQEATVATDPIVGNALINTASRLYLERQSFDEYMDSVESTTSNASGVVTGLTHLAGQQVYTIVNGATVGSSFVDSSGQTTVKALSADVKIGLQFRPELIPMPLYAPTQEGDSLYAEKYVQDIYIDYVDSLYLKAGVKPQLTDIPNLPLGNYTLGASVPPQTGIYKIAPRGGWQPRQEYVITQSQPGPMTIIGVGYNVEVS